MPLLQFSQLRGLFELSIIVIYAFNSFCLSVTGIITSVYRPLKSGYYRRFGIAGSVEPFFLPLQEKSIQKQDRFPETSFAQYVLSLPKGNKNLMQPYHHNIEFVYDLWQILKPHF